MKISASLALLLLVVPATAFSASTKAPVSNSVFDPVVPDSTTASGSAAAPAVIDSKSKIPPMGQLLAQGFEIKAAFIDATNIAYVALQRGTSAYLCHSGAIPACDKLN